MPSRTPRFEKKENSSCDACRIIDANLNRAKEGLRVCEEISRYYLKDRDMTETFRDMRHQLTSIIKTSKIEPFKLFQGRDAQKDPGKKFVTKAGRKSFRGIFMANSQRVKESLRVLEEFLKLFDTRQSKKIQEFRFDFYDLEKEAVEKFPALLDS